MLKRYINKWKHSLNAKTFYAIKSNPMLFFNTLVFDFLFLVILYYINVLTRLSLPTEEALTPNIGFVVSFLLFTMIYLLLLIFIYSFLKYCILDFIKMLVDLSWKFRKITREKKFDLSRFFKFCFLNLIILVSSFIMFTILNAVYFFSVKQEYLNIIFLLTMVPLFLFIYAYLNITHSLFTLGFDLKETIRKGFVLLKKIRSYYVVFISSVLFILAYSLIYFIIALIITSLTSVNLPVYNIVFTVITTVVFYLIIAFNRTYFYLIVDIIKENE